MSPTKKITVNEVEIAITQTLDKKMRQEISTKTKISRLPEGQNKQ